MSFERRIASPIGRRVTLDTPSQAKSAAPLAVGLLTGADDKSYALGLTSALVAQDIRVDFIGSNQIDGPELHATPLVRFLNLRGDQSESAPLLRKAGRLLLYYLRLLQYAVRAEPRLFHILWNNKFQLFDRTLLMLFYRMMGRRVVLTAHNVNAAKRDGRDNASNRASLRIQYQLASHVFVHTQRMRGELRADFGIPDRKTSVIPFGLNDTAPTTELTGTQARARIGLSAGERVMLFFGQIAPYKGLEHLVAALPGLLRADPALRLVIAGKVKRGCEEYWSAIERQLADPGVGGCVVQRIEHIPDADIETYFKAADVLIIPYVHIFQSGVPFLAYSFGLPVIATDVGSLRDDIVEGQTGLICRPGDPADLARGIAAFFDSDLYRNLDLVRPRIRAQAIESHSWATVASLTQAVYQSVLAGR